MATDSYHIQKRGLAPFFLLLCLFTLFSCRPNDEKRVKEITQTLLSQAAEGDLGTLPGMDLQDLTESQQQELRSFFSELKVLHIGITVENDRAESLVSCRVEEREYQMILSFERSDEDWIPVGTLQANRTWNIEKVESL